MFPVQGVSGTQWIPAWYHPQKFSIFAGPDAVMTSEGDGAVVERIGDFVVKNPRHLAGQRLGICVI